MAFAAQSFRTFAASRVGTLRRQVAARSARIPPSKVMPASYGPYLSPEGYAESFEPVLDNVFSNPDGKNVGMLEVFDIDGTLNLSSGTGSPGKLPDDVLEALVNMHGAGDRVFVMAATGRSPEDAQKAFGDFPIPLVANDGSWIRFPDGTVIEYPFPEVPEFDFLASAIVANDVISASNLNLPVGVGLSFPKKLASLHAYTYYKELFEMLVAARNKEKKLLALYPHNYPATVELVIQNGLRTKATGIITMVTWLQTVYGLDEVYVFGHGNSSNDKPMILLANEMKQQKRFGGSFWVGDINTEATGSFKEVRDLQLALIILAGKVAEALAGLAV